VGRAATATPATTLLYVHKTARDLRIPRESTGRLRRPSFLALGDPSSDWRLPPEAAGGAMAAPATAAGAGQGQGEGKEYPGRLTLYVFLTCAVAATGGLIVGYDIGISGNRPFLHRSRA